jgi:hypothetical protein
MHPRRVTHGAQAVRDGVQWVLKDLKPGEDKTLTVALVTTSPGTRKVRFTAKADKGDEQRTEVPTAFDGVANLDWDVEAPGIASVGRGTSYRVTVTNRGSAPGRARVQVDLPLTVDPTETVPRAGRGHGQTAHEVRFPEEPIPPGKKATYVVRAVPRQEGESRVVFTLFEDEREGKKATKVTNVVKTDTRSPTGPPPARGVDPSKVGSSPRD